MQIIGCAPGGALRGWAPLASRSPSGFDSLRGIKMYALSPGCGSFRRRPFSGSPCPPRRCGGGWAAAPAPACRGFPPALAPVAPGARRAVCAQGFLSAASGRPCAPLCVSPLCSAPSLARAGLRGAVERPRAPSPWARARFGRGRRCPPAPPPSGGFARSRSPGGAPAGAACAAPFCASVAPPGVGVGAAAAAAAARLRLSVSPRARLWAGAALLCSCARSMLHQACACCPHSRCLAWALVSPPEKIDNAFRERDSPQEIRRAAAISAQEIFRVN